MGASNGRLQATINSHVAFVGAEIRHNVGARVEEGAPTNQDRTQHRAAKYPRVWGDPRSVEIVEIVEIVEVRLKKK